MERVEKPARVPTAMGGTAGDGRRNNFGFLRLLFAMLVIVSHAPELVDGDRSREILTATFHTMSFGEVAVDGFFLISGYLIAKSFVGSPSVAAYFARRALRIVPGYAVCFLVCVLAVGPFVVPGAPSLPLSTALRQIRFLVLLMPPDLPGAFHGAHYELLNGALWTIAYEFRCYVAVALLGLMGAWAPERRGAVLAGVAVLVALNAAGALDGVTMIGTSLLGAPDQSLRFFAVFGVGALYYLYGDKIRLTHRGAAVAAVLLATLFFHHRSAEAALMVFGGYLVFWFAFKVPVLRLSRFDNRADISYGVYLYAWPLQSLIVWRFPTVDPWLLCGIAALGAGALGCASWVLVEHPALGLLRRGRRAFFLAS